MSRAMGKFECRQSDDDVKRDLELTCVVCGVHVCDVEAGDMLETLVAVAADHRCQSEIDEPA